MENFVGVTKCSFQKSCVQLFRRRGGNDEDIKIQQYVLSTPNGKRASKGESHDQIFIFPYNRSKSSQLASILLCNSDL